MAEREGFIFRFKDAGLPERLVDGRLYRRDESRNTKTALIINDSITNMQEVNADGS